MVQAFSHETWDPLKAHARWRNAFPGKQLVVLANQQQAGRPGTGQAGAGSRATATVPSGQPYVTALTLGAAAVVVVVTT